LIELDPKKIAISPYQPRKMFREEELEELAHSIRAVGLLHPPLVRPLADGTYELVSGERRLRAAQRAGMETIPVVVRAVPDETTAQAALIENVQRVDLNPIEVAKALQRLLDEFGYSQAELAERVGKKRSTVATYLRLLGLPEEIQESLGRGEITMGHAKAVLSAKGAEQLPLHQQIMRERLTVRQAEQKQKKPDIYGEDLRRRLERHLGTRVKVKRGKITLEYYNLDDLDRLLEVMGVH
jgi:ParB family transcriptional regulator, chromosome partitioning protein